MSETPAAKKARVEGEEDGKEEDASIPRATAKDQEFEVDAAFDGRPKIKDAVGFHLEETTMNVMPSSFGNILTSLSDGGLQYLLAGARANVGVKSGRYMFEIKVLEFINPLDEPSARSRHLLPRNMLRVGFSTAGSSLFLGETCDSVCFDLDASYIHNKNKSQAAPKAVVRDNTGAVFAVLVNLDDKSPNFNTVSFFRDGVRVSSPQPLPDNLKGKALYPAVTYKNLTFHFNFGPLPLTPLPFKCRMVQDAAQRDVAATASALPKDGKYEVLFPVSLPDEGTFDWLDLFLEKNPQYTEVSDRAIVAWAEHSGISISKGNNLRSSNDKPEMNFGMSMMDDLSIRRVLQFVLPLQPRNYVVMEVKSNLMKEERKDALLRWPSLTFRRVAVCMMGEPPAVVKKRAQELMLTQKQDALDVEFNARKEEAARKRLVEKRQKELERARRKAEKQRKRLEAETKKRIDEEIKKRKTEATENEEGEGEEKKEEEDKVKEEADGENDVEEEKEEESEEEKEEPEEPEEPEPAKAELTEEETKLWFRKSSVPDLTPYVLSTCFAKFSVPDKEEGFDEIRTEWQKGDKCREHLRSWIQDRKLTTRVEDLSPGDWFTTQCKEWQKTLAAWHTKQNTYKSAIAKKAADRAAREAKRAAKKAFKDAKEKAVAERASRKAAREIAREKADDGSLQAPLEEPEDEEPDAAMEEEGDDPPEEEDEQDGVDYVLGKVDAFGVDDICDIDGTGEPLFARFGFEDWALTTLRFEMHLLAHAFRRDVNDPDRVGVYLEHLAYYYSKYFKKQLNLKLFGVETVKELLENATDTLRISKNQCVEAALPDDMESYNIFVMLTEEARRDRQRRLDLGDEGARLKICQPGMPPQGQQQGPGKGAFGQAGVMPPQFQMPAGMPAGVQQPTWFQGQGQVRNATHVYRPTGPGGYGGGGGGAYGGYGGRGGYGGGYRQGWQGGSWPGR